MAIPDFCSIMLPLLGFFKDRKEHSFHETVQYISDFFRLDETERRMLLPNEKLFGRKEAIIDNRVGLAITYLEKAVLLEATGRGLEVFRITSRGLEVLERNPSAIDLKYLGQFEEYVQSFKTLKEVEEKNIIPRTPDELVGSYRELADELLRPIKKLFKAHK
jgi:restriction system protein